MSLCLLSIRFLVFILTLPTSLAPSALIDPSTTPPSHPRIPETGYQIALFRSAHAAAAHDSLDRVQYHRFLLRTTKEAFRGVLVVVVVVAT